MKKYLSWIIIFILMAAPTWSYAASYYGCANANINADSTFCTTATGSCTGNDPVTAATALAGTHTLFANGCTITIPSTADLTVTAAKLSNKDDGGAMVDGGSFTYTTSASYTLTINAAIENGATSSAHTINISGTASGAARVTVQGNLTGGSASTASAVYCNQSNGGVVIGSSGSPVTITGGATAASAHGLASSSTGPVTIYADVSPGAAATGVSNNATAAMSITGTCTGAGNINACQNGAGGTISVTNCTGSSAGYGLGCYGPGAGAITVTGNITNSGRAAGAHGTIVWAPSNAQKYVKFDGGGTAVYLGAGLGSDAGGTQVSAANTAAEIKTTSYFVKKDDGVYTQGTATAGGANSYAF
jgi:hypothetical protein